MATKAGDEAVTEKLLDGWNKIMSKAKANKGLAAPAMKKLPGVKVQIALTKLKKAVSDSEKKFDATEKAFMREFNGLRDQVKTELEVLGEGTTVAELEKRKTSLLDQLGTLARLVGTYETDLQALRKKINDHLIMTIDAYDAVREAAPKKSGQSSKKEKITVKALGATLEGTEADRKKWLEELRDIQDYDSKLTSKIGDWKQWAGMAKKAIADQARIVSSAKVR